MHGLEWGAVIGREAGVGQRECCVEIRVVMIFRMRQFASASSSLLSFAQPVGQAALETAMELGQSVSMLVAAEAQKQPRVSVALR
jgi:hypothetical protein